MIQQFDIVELTDSQKTFSNYFICIRRFQPSAGMIMHGDNGAGIFQQSQVIDFLWIDLDRALGAKPNQLKVSNCLSSVQAEDPKVFTGTIAFGAAAEDRLHKVEDVRRGSDVDLLMGAETNGHGT